MISVAKEKDQAELREQIAAEFDKVAAAAA